MNGVLRYYRKKQTNEPLGAVYIDEDGQVGWSLYNQRAEREAGVPFTKHRARQIAIGRASAVKGKDYFLELPWKLWETYKRALYFWYKKYALDPAGSYEHLVEEELEQLRQAHEFRRKRRIANAIKAFTEKPVAGECKWT